jgi:hypothetical protein
MKNRLTYMFAIGLLAIGGFAMNAQDHQPAAAATVKPIAGVKAGNCAGCHQKAKVLPDGHADTKEMTLSDCKQCHTGGEGNPPALETKIPLWHMHGLNGITCVQCHTAGTHQPATRRTCLQCHDPKVLAEKTATLNPENPHNNRHFGTEENCNDCHHMHKLSENHCAECHNFKLRVP